MSNGVQPDDDGGGGGGGKDNDHQCERANASERAGDDATTVVTEKQCEERLLRDAWIMSSTYSRSLMARVFTPDDWPRLLLKDSDVHNLGRGERVIGYRSQVLMFCLHSAENGGGDLKGGECIIRHRHLITLPPWQKKGEAALASAVSFLPIR